MVPTLGSMCGFLDKDTRVRYGFGYGSRIRGVPLLFFPAAGSPTTTLLRLHPSYLPVLQKDFPRHLKMLNTFYFTQ